MTTTPARPRFTIPGLTPEQGAEVGGILQDRLNALNDLALTLKHIHWNVVGQNFIAVHEMLDPQIEAVRGMVDDTAERMATMGISPRAPPAPSSSSAPGTTTRSGARPRRSTSVRSTWSTPASSRATGPRRRRRPTSTR
ncbi:hypothetical protein GCM10025868_12440 [Angustibacter aerolatus]|uniref:Ferritin/DPS domain-containing protein n=1 Tax=Angustibacter aerolatus TaxID=1162965 RepID=A0ABQ6JDW2_9ACTN|nr:ferritin-like domain-containing protein [Angustibacter aerolatus]GMA85994.1 hypothetical protein GCM10025868_12440 [Angustibacter aerolatus]